MSGAEFGVGRRVFAWGLAVVQARAPAARRLARNLSRVRKWREDSQPDGREREMGRKTPHNEQRC